MSIYDSSALYSQKQWEEREIEHQAELRVLRDKLDSVRLEPPTPITVGTDKLQELFQQNYVNKVDSNGTPLPANLDCFHHYIDKDHCILHFQAGAFLKGDFKKQVLSALIDVQDLINLYIEYLKVED